MLFLSFVYTGLSGGEDVKVLYGERHKLYLKSRAEYVYFESEAHYPSIKVNLWTRSKPSDTIRGFFDGTRYFVIEKLTQADNGTYTIRSQLNSTFATFRIIVSRKCALPACALHDSWIPAFMCGDSTNIWSKKRASPFLRYNLISSVFLSAHEKHFSKNVGENIQFDIPMELKSCFATFTSSYDGDTTIISSDGYERQSHFGGRLYFSHSPLQTHVEIDDLKVQDSGVFKMQDDKNNLVMMVNLEVEGEWPSTSCLSGAIHALLTYHLDITGYYYIRMFIRRLALFNCQSMFRLCKKR